HVAEARRLEMVLDFSPRLPRAIYTDAKRLQQVLKNLLSNAFKFTERGRVSMEVGPASSGWSSECETLNELGTAIAMSVRATGIGIVWDKQQIIFEAFQQADGSTSRKYGGTGLGLAISRELARLLGGDIRLVSSPGTGSLFTLYLPVTYAPARSVKRPLLPPAADEVEPAAKPTAELEPAPEPEELPTPLVSQVIDDSANIFPGDRVLLIVENDLSFARFLLEVAHDHGLKGVLAYRGAAALAL